MRFLEKIISKLNVGMMWVAGFMIIFMGFSTTADVILRAFFNSPLTWSFDTVCYLNAAAAFLAGGFGLLTDRHVRVDVVYERFSPRTKGVMDVCTSFLFFLFCLVLVWMGGETALESWQSKALAGNVLNPPLYLPQLLLPVGGLLMGLQGVFRLIRDFKLALGHKQEEGRMS
ncbi:MAG: TRAP transporter small permease subunit [Bacillota bacterium]